MALIVQVALLAVIGPAAVRAQATDDINGLIDERARLEVRGEYDKAILISERTVALLHQRHGEDHPLVQATLGSLARLYKVQGRYGEAERLRQRILASSEKVFGLEHRVVGIALNNLAALYYALGRYSAAEPLYQRSLAIMEKEQGPDHHDVGAVLHNLASVYQAQGRYKEAEPLHRRALTIEEKKGGGPHHPDAGRYVNDLALLYFRQGRYNEAEPLYQRSLAIREKVLGPDNPDLAIVLENLAELHFAQRDWARSVDYWRRSTSVIVARARRGTDDVGQGLTAKRKGEAERHRYSFWGLVNVAHRLAAQDRGADASLSREMFQTAQWASTSEAAQSLAQMAARGAKGDPVLATLVRERQDLVGEWQKRDVSRSAAVSKAPEKRDHAADATNSARMAVIDTRIAEIDRRLKAEFPDYTALSRPEPLTVEQVQAELRADEALVLFLDLPELKLTPQETFIWVVTKTHMRWVRSELGRPALTREVAALRCGLDATARTDSACSGFKSKPWGSLPFDYTRSQKLYVALFGELADLINGKHLLLVPSGPLTQLPFQVLVTEPPKGNDPKAIRWLIRDHALTVLPAVSSLRALRRNARASSAPEPFIGYGNPVLTGQPGCGKIIIPEKCPDEPVQLAVTATAAIRSVGPIAASAAYFRDGLADVASVRQLCPLPDTAHELKCVARSLGAPPSSIVLGSSMTETALKKEPLNRYRIIHFATHGLLAAETGAVFNARAEPALVMTPPRVATETDDGLLTASEVAALKLDADWVVMSACNTAAGGTKDAEALSGLARAFFYAGTRALLVSHWPVNSYAATMLTSGTFAQMRKEKSIGRSEAFRRAMLALMSDKKRPWAAHPSVWAPFIVVGEGSATTR